MNSLKQKRTLIWLSRISEIEDSGKPLTGTKKTVMLLSKAAQDSFPAISLFYVLSCVVYLAGFAILDIKTISPILIAGTMILSITDSFFTVFYNDNYKSILEDASPDELEEATKLDEQYLLSIRILAVVSMVALVFLMQSR
jgi:glucan phosphoethanolaminetransferase (alkaline phosphatase superfamily)